MVSGGRGGGAAGAKSMQNFPACNELRRMDFPLFTDIGNNFCDILLSYKPIFL